MSVSPFDVFDVTPVQRIAATKLILSIVRQLQAKDGGTDFRPDVKSEYHNFINFLCEVGFIRKVKDLDDGFPYRLMWKGLCFLDTVNFLEQISKIHPPDSIQGLNAQLAVFAFH